MNEIAYTGSRYQRLGWVVVAAIALVGLAFAACFYTLLALATVTMCVLALPLVLAKRVDWFSTWNFLFYSAFLGIFLRCLYITFDIPDAQAIDSAFLLGQPKEFLYVPMLLLLAGMSTMTAGYFCGPSVARRLPWRIFGDVEWSDKRYRQLTSVFLFLALAGTIMLMRRIGLESILLNLSSVRGVSADLEEYRSMGVLRWVSQLSDPILYIAVARMCQVRRFRLFDAVVFALAGLNSVALGSLVSSRGQVIMLIVNTCAIIYYNRNRKIKTSTVMVAIVLVVVCFNILSSFRVGMVRGSNSSAIASALEPMVLATNYVDVSKTAHIIAAIPKQLDYAYGLTYLTFLYGWIPRELWPRKPVVNVDNTVGIAVFGASVYGAGAVPPGVVAEAYWNFWYPGIFIVCFAVGYGLRAVMTQFRAYAHSQSAIVLYVAIFMNLGMSFAGSSFSPIILGIVASGLPMVVILGLMSTPRSTAGKVGSENTP